MMYIIRHALRSDSGSLEDKKTVKLPFDTPINQLGRLQAYTVGQKLQLEIPELKKKKLLFICSPYLRCLQTTEQIIIGLEINQSSILHETIFVEDAVRESQFEFHSKPCDFRKLTFFDGTQLVDQKTEYNKLDMFSTFRHSSDFYPENNLDLKKRSVKTVEELRKFVAHEDNKEVLPIVISHGFWVKELWNMFNKNDELPDCYYCNVSRLSLGEDGKFKADYINKKMY